jgi:hypothetical protein
MSRQSEALPSIVAGCVAVDPACGVMLQGSVARGCEREDSDVDVTVVTSDREDLAFNEILNPGNHGAMTRVVVDGVNVDINWIRASELLEQGAARGFAGWWMFRHGRPVQDPEGLAARCQAEIVAWFESQPAVAAAWARQQELLEAHKRDRSRELEFPTFGAFHAHVRDLVVRSERTET